MRIDVDGCNNFRDLGGYPASGGTRVRSGQVFRADALHHLTDTGVRSVWEDLGVRHVIDLRSSAEVEIDGRGPLEESGVTFHHLPLFDGDRTANRETPEGWTLAELYFGMMDHAAGPIVDVVETLASSDGPAVFHCTAGKDRTGVISAVLLGALGVPDDVIVVDYAATKEGLDAIVERLMASEGYKDMFANLPPDTLHAEPETMSGLLERVRDTHGSMESYLTASGSKPDLVDRLRSRMLEAS